MLNDLVIMLGNWKTGYGSCSNCKWKIATAIAANAAQHVELISLPGFPQ